MAEEILRSEYLYRGRVVKLRLDQVRLANRSVVAREIVEHRGAVAMVPLDAQNRVVMVRQYRSAAAREMLEIPAGTLEDGEDPALCATRELKEETGYTALEWHDLGFFYSSPGFSTEKMTLYLARQLTAGNASPEDDELIHTEHIPFAEAIAKIERGEILDGKTIIGLLRVKSLLVL
ncbi:MAG: NUDIX hydrolase [Chloroflexi bacterium]|nr:NUDIX hydrolase [Chloroflexota bacterium]